MKEIKIKLQRKKRRLSRVRKKIVASSKRPRLTVFRSNKHFYAQIIDDIKGITLTSAHENELEVKTGTKTEKAEKLGTLLSQKAHEKKIQKVVFDKGSYKYHGRVKVFAQAAREGGLQF